MSLSLALAEDSKTTYETKCAKCHGVEGKGDTKMGQKLNVKDMSLSKNWEGITDEKAAKAIKEGIRKDDKTMMKANDDLTDADITGLVTYFKTLKK